MSDTAVHDDLNLADAVTRFARITEELRDGYAVLSQRAERVEHELMLANTELEARLAELDAVKRHLEAILQALPTGVIVRDGQGRILSVNRAAQSILGVEDEAGVERLLSAFGSGEGDTRHDFELERDDGARRVLSSDCSPVFGPDESLMGSVQIVDDHTSNTLLTERLHAMDKLAALGTMAGGIAHEIRNPLNAVQGFASLLLKELEPGTTAHRWASLIVEGSEEANGIVRSMLGFAKPEKLCLEPVDAEELVAGATSSLGQSTESFPWTVSSTVEPVRFLGDRIKLRQALRNLVLNAINAQPEGGNVHVSLSRQGDEITVTVADAGTGIPPEIADRILDPFFTTRADGTGLGLALANTIAQLHGGEISISPTPSSLGGAEVALRFPCNPSNG